MCGDSRIALSCYSALICHTARTKHSQNFHRGGEKKKICARQCWLVPWGASVEGVACVYI